MMNWEKYFFSAKNSRHCKENSKACKLLNHYKTKRILLHVGPHKTGTTAIQEALTQTQGINYPPVTEQGPGHASYAWRTLGIEGNRPDPDLLCNLVGEYSGTDLPLILSAEDFCYAIMPGCNCEGIVNLAKEFAVELIITLTPLARRMVSTIQERIKHKQIIDFGDEPLISEVMKREPGFHPHLLEALFDLARWHKTHVVFVDKSRPGHLFNAFSNILHVPIIYEPDNEARKNSRLPYGHLVFMNALNKLAPDAAVEDVSTVAREAYQKASEVIPDLAKLDYPTLPRKIEARLHKIWVQQTELIRDWKKAGIARVYYRSRDASVKKLSKHYETQIVGAPGQDNADSQQVMELVVANETLQREYELQLKGLVLANETLQRELALRPKLTQRELIEFLAIFEKPHSTIKLPDEIRTLNRIKIGRIREFRRLRIEYQRLSRDYKAIAASALFDSKWYLTTNPDVAAAGADPALHYLLYGGSEGRAPGPLFDASRYTDAFPDVKIKGLNPLLHFLNDARSDQRELQKLASQKSPSVSLAGAEAAYVSMPFSYLPEPIWPLPRIAVMLHVYYIDVLPQLLTALGNIPYCFSLFVSTDTDEKKAMILRHLVDWKNGIVSVAVILNRGRDVAPRFVDFGEFYRRFDYVLHVHTKKSLHNTKLSGWLEQMLYDLLGSKQIVQNIFETFLQVPHMGVIAPRHFNLIRKFVGWGNNFHNCAALASRMGFELKPGDPCEFPAGSVFWARTGALKPLLDLHIGRHEFEPEQGQTDGTLAHAIERMIFLSAEVAGYRWCFVGNSTNDRIAPAARINSKKELMDRLKQLETQLLPDEARTQLT